jgi:hypothetical protein
MNSRRVARELWRGIIQYLQGSEIPREKGLVDVRLAASAAADHFFAVVGRVFREHGAGSACCRSKKFG